MNITRRRRARGGMNIFPLIDVVFLLLIFFMLTSKFITQTSHSIALPKSTTAKKLENEQIIVHVTKQEKIYINEEKQEVPLINLKARIESELAKYPKKPPVIIKGDEKISLGLTIQLLDIVKTAGGESVDITTIEPGSD